MRYLLIFVWIFDEGDGIIFIDLFWEKKIFFFNELWLLFLWELSDFEYLKYIYLEIF